MKLITQIIASERFFCEAVDFIDFFLVCLFVFMYSSIFTDFNGQIGIVYLEQRRWTMFE